MLFSGCRITYKHRIYGHKRKDWLVDVNHSKVNLVLTHPQSDGSDKPLRPAGSSLPKVYKVVETALYASTGLRVSCPGPTHAL